MIPRSLVSALCVAIIVVPAAHAQDSTALAENAPITRQLGPDQTHTFRVQLSANQFVLGEADQHDIDVVVRIIGPDGEEISEFDSPARGPEPFSFSTTTAGTYDIMVASFDDDETGSYTIRLDRVDAVASTRDGRVDQLFAAWDRPGSPGAAVAIAQECTPHWFTLALAHREKSEPTSDGRTAPTRRSGSRAPRPGRRTRRNSARRR